MAVVAALMWLAASGSTFDPAELRDTTLRIDYILTGDPGGNISIGYSDLSQTDGWHGRRCNLDSAVVEGSADLILCDAATGRVLYRQPFCTLFQEWLVSDDTRGPVSMEGTVVVPMPRKPAVATITLRDNRHRPVARASLAIDPDDILIARRPRHTPDTTTTIYRGQAPEDRRIKVAIIGEGFTADETDRFNDCASQAAGAILSTEPFASYIDNFEFVAVATPSAQSGVSVPHLGVWADTPYGSHFSTFYSDRYLTIPHVWRLYDTAVDAGCDHIIVLANTEEYGGGGILNFYTITAAGHPLFEKVVVHEFGHSFAGLADEYYYDNEDYADEIGRAHV